MRLELLYLPPSLKNRKRVSGGRLVTDPEVQHVMEQITNDFVLQIYSEYQRQKAVGEISTICTLPSWIALNVPLDDSATWISESHQQIEIVTPDNESTSLIIERI